MKNNTEIAEKVFNEISASRPGIERKGFYVGQGVACLYQEIVESETQGNSMDITYLFEYEESCSTKNSERYFHKQKVLDYVFNEAIKRKSLSFYKVEKYCDIESLEIISHKFYCNAEKLKYVVHTQALNCDQIGLAFDENEQAVLYKSTDYEAFLENGKILMVSFHSYLSALEQAELRLKDLSRSSFHLDLYIEPLLANDSLFIQNEIGVLSVDEELEEDESLLLTLGDESDFAKAYDFIDRNGLYSHWLESLIVKDKSYMTNSINEFERKIILQSMGIDYGISGEKKEFIRAVLDQGVSVSLDDLEQSFEVYSGVDEFILVWNWYLKTLPTLSLDSVPWALIEYLYAQRKQYSDIWLKRLDAFFRPHIFFKYFAIEDIGIELLDQSRHHAFNKSFKAFEDCVNEFYCRLEETKKSVILTSKHKL